MCLVSISCILVDRSPFLRKKTIHAGFPREQLALGARKSHERPRKVMRKLLCLVGYSLLFISPCNGPCLNERNAFGQTQTEEPRFTPPPGAETAEIRNLIDKAQSSLETGRVTTTALLTDPAFMSAHEFPRFRQLIRDGAKTNQATLVSPQEPGESLIVNGVIRDQQARPIKGALIYVYQTSAKGWYSDKAPHISGMSGDEKYARLFAYLTTNQDGQYEIRTIRPAGYPNSNLPAHIHIEIKAPGNERTALISEILFDDDPRLTKEMRDRSSREKLFVFPVQREAKGLQRVKADFRL
jgi:protocatechuate 3,4-dioxygenase beta subunit